jgi:IclR family transcriptional regulator, KDG regulon repressor
LLRSTLRTITLYREPYKANMKTDFKRVPAVDKCFAILDLLAREKKAMGISRIAESLGLNKSTVFNMIHTLTDLGVLENGDGKYRFGTKLYLLGKAAKDGSDLIRIIHPYLEEMSRLTGLSVFLGMRSGGKAVILDKVDSSVGLKVSTDVGIRIPLVAGAGGKVLLAQLTDQEIDAILDRYELRPMTPNSCTDPDRYREMIEKARQDTLAFDHEEYIEGIRAVAVPVDISRPDLKLAVWAVGLKTQLDKRTMKAHARVMMDLRNKIEAHFML